MVDRWEYKTITLSTGQTPKSWDQELGYWGSEGWELVSIVVFPNDHRAIFKRRLPVEIAKTKLDPWTDHGWG